MYIKTTVRKTKNSEVRYLQLAHNEWDAAARRSVPKVLYSFGREDQLDTDAIRRLVTALSRLLSPADALAATADGDLVFTESRPYGGSYDLDQLWTRLGIGKILTSLASTGRGRPRDAAAAERVLFGLVANRALAPSSKLAAAEWMSQDVHIGGLGTVTDDACYRAMDWLRTVRGDLERQVEFDMRDWVLGNVIWVADRGFSSARNRRFVQQGAGGYIIGEKLRTESPLVKAALSRQGRYQQVAGNMQVKEVRLPDTTDRLVICYNPDGAGRDAAIRAELIAKLEEMIAGTDKLTATKRAELRGKISTMPGLNRFLRVTPGGLLRTDKTKAKAEENLDGKYLLRCGDPQLSAEDIAVGYKQLLEVESGWRDMKSVLDLRPVYHRLEERIRAHVLLCWLALLLVRVAENTTGQTWPVMRRELGRIHLGTFTGPAGTFRQRTELPEAARDLLAGLGLDAPRKIHELA